MGEWGKENLKQKPKPGLSNSQASAEGNQGLEQFQCDRKLDLLAAEGVPFDKKGILKSRDYLWDGKST